MGKYDILFSSMMMNIYIQIQLSSIIIQTLSPTLIQTLYFTLIHINNK